jgi:hypothetical protein
MLRAPVGVPGPPAGLWGLALLAWAAGATLLGEALRGVIGRWVSLWRAPELLERLVLDLYLGGAALYLVAALELGAFTAPVVLGLPVLAGVAVVLRVRRARRDRRPSAVAETLLGGLRRPWVALALASALGLYVVELAYAASAGTGNTFDSSLLTTYVALLLQHGSVPLTFAPYGAPAILYPQATTVWLGSAQLTFGLPAARTSLLVTPLFLALPPLSGFVLGRRLTGSEPVGAAFALALACLGPSTRGLVGGSNDFVFAFPLVLWLAAQAPRWARPPLLSWGDALGFGLLLGYAGALNVTGSQWLLPALLILGALTAPRYGGRALAWAGRWLAASGSALVAGLPSIYVLLAARAMPGSLAGALTAPAGRSVGIGAPQLLASVDPFLFGPGDVALSPIPAIRIELAILLVVALAYLLGLVGRPAERTRWAEFVRLGLASGTSLVAWLLVLAAAGAPGSPVRALAFVSNYQEFAAYLFALYGLVAAVPLAVALEALRAPRPAGPVAAGSGPGERRPLAPGPALAAVALALVIVVPAAVLTPVSLGPVLHGYYQEFGNVSEADFALLAYGGSHFAAGSRVLVAPGSAAEFLPGYARGIVLLYPMAPGWSRANASYALVVQQLTYGTLDAGGRAALAALVADYVVVTGNNTVLWPAFWAAPLLAAESGGVPTFPVLWHEGDAWVFNASACRLGSPGCS